MEVRGVLAFAGSSSGAVLEKPPDEVFYSRMRVCLCSCLSFVSGSLIWLFSFIAGRLFRIVGRKSSKIHGLKPSSVNDLFEEKDAPCLTFKFQHQISALQNSSDRERPRYDDAKEDISYTTSTNTNNYRFASVKDSSGFVEEPKVKTFFVEESLGHPDIGSNINTLRATGFPASEADPLPSAKAADLFAVHTVENLDGTREVKLPSIEPPEKEKPLNSGIKLSGKLEVPSQAKFLFRDFSGFDSDTESLTASDGYSVKELVVDSDSDGLLSDHEQHEAKDAAKRFMDANRYKLKLLADIRRLEAAQSKLAHDYDEEFTLEVDKFSFINREQKGLRRGEAESVEREEIEQTKLPLTSDPLTDSSNGGHHDAQKQIIILRKNSDGILFSDDVVKPDGVQDGGRNDDEKQIILRKNPDDILLSDDVVKPDGVQDGGHHDAQKQIILRKNSDGILFSDDVVKSDGVQDEDLDEKGMRTDNNIDSTESADRVIGGSTNFSQKIPGTDREDAVLMEELDALEHVKELEGDSVIDGLTKFYRKIPDADEEDASLMAELDALEHARELEGEIGTRKDGKEKRETNVDDWDDEEESSDEDDSDDEFGSLWEHEDLIEQLKNEIKRVKAIKLPTINEESEALKTDNDLQPWTTDEKFLHEDPMDELHKFYNCYRERMRKLDILNYQKMHAVGLLQVKDPFSSQMGHQKSLIPAIASILSQSFRSCSGKFGINPSEKFIKELQYDLEMVYVGQTCLSWEFLCWQYEKVQQLPESDPYRGHQYNQVAGQFQQFQVTMQRFIEDETFQGPRLPNYVKNRCGPQNLLLVPVIREDSMKEKREDQQKGNYVITSEILEDILEESIRIFWEFVKADKDEASGILKGLMGPRAELQDPSDNDLMAEIYSNLQKKEKKLKDLVRTGNCLVKKFKKPKEYRSDQDLFFSQIDLKLISRVLRMSRVSTEQLVWCHAKLSCITFIDGKVHREPSFLLFPC